MENNKTNFFESVCKYLLLLCAVYLYIFACGYCYHALERFDATDPSLQNKLNSVQSFLINTNINGKAYPQDFLKSYEKAVATEKYWKTRKMFNSITKAYVFTLKTHTTIGNSNDMYLQSWHSKLFYIFTVPLGVLLFFLAIHYTAKPIASNLNLAVMIIWRNEDSNWNDGQIYAFLRLKRLSFSVVLLIVIWLTLSLFCLLDKISYLSELFNFMMVLFKINDSELFSQTRIDDENVYAVILSFVYFICVLCGYLIVYCAVDLCYNHSFLQIKSLLKEDPYEPVATSCNTRGTK